MIVKSSVCNNLQHSSAITIPARFGHHSAVHRMAVPEGTLPADISPMPLNNIVRIHFQQIATNDSHNCSIFAPVFQKPACLSLISGYSMCIPTWGARRPGFPTVWAHKLCRGLWVNLEGSIKSSATTWATLEERTIENLCQNRLSASESLERQPSNWWIRNPCNKNKHFCYL